ncbi:MAG: tetratricopeptide repeat protein [Candidatus Eisenbacteria bacterium]
MITDFGLAVTVKNGKSDPKPEPSKRNPPAQMPAPNASADDATHLLEPLDPGDTIATPTSEPAIVGTPAYMSPEQVTGGPIGPASDLYALGVVLFEMATGRLPFSGRTPVDTARAHVTAQPPNPSTLGSVDPRWERAILRLLSKDPTARHANAADVVLALEDRLEPTEVVRHSLPPERDTFVGRREDIEAVSARLERGNGNTERLLTLQGTGGTGKTRLALRYAWESLPRWPGGVWFCDLSEAHAAEGIAAAVATALDVALDERDPITHLANVMAGRGKSLFILDNFEHLVDHADATLGRWLRTSATTRFLVTSRERLRLPGETTYELGPLDPETQGAELFAIRAAAHRPGFEVDATNRNHVDEIVRRLDGLPLAIELAASRLRVLSLEQLQTRLEDRFRILAGGKPGRHRTLRTTLDWSWELLRPWEQSAMAQISAFEGGFTLEAAESVIDLSMYDEDPFVLDVIQSLVDKSWLRAKVALGALRFSVYASVQEYAAEQAEGYSRTDDAQSPKQVEARHGTHFARVGTESLAGVHFRRGTAIRTALLFERDNLIVACRRAIARGDSATAEATYLAADVTLCVRGPFGVSSELGGQVVALLDAGNRGRALVCLGNTERRSGNVQRAREIYETALAEARAVGDRRLEGTLISHTAVLDASQGRIKEAMEGMQTSLALAREHGDRIVEGNDLGNLGVLCSRQGRVAEAQIHYEAALAVHRESGHREGEGSILSALGNLLIDQSRFEEARERCAAAMVIARELGDRVQEGYALSTLSLIDRIQGHLGDAMSHCTSALDIARWSGDRRFEGYLLGELATLHHAYGRAGAARECFEEALAIARQVRNPAGEGSALENLGSLLGEDGRFDEAQEHIEAALTVHRELGDGTAEGIALRILGDIDRRRGQLDAARSNLGRSESILREGDDRFELGLVLCARGELEIREQHIIPARAALSEAESIARDLVLQPESELVRRIETLREAIASAGETHKK